MRTPFLWFGSQPVRVFSVTGTRRLARRCAKFVQPAASSCSRAEPANRLQTFLAGQPMLMSMICGAGIDIAPRSIGHHRRIEAGDLHHARAGFAGMVHAAARFRRVPQAHVGAEHFRGGESGAEAPAQNAKRTVGHARHGREQDVGRQRIGTDLDGSSLGLGCGASSFGARNSSDRRRAGTRRFRILPRFCPGSRISKVASARSPGASSRRSACPSIRRLEVARADAACRSDWRASRAAAGRAAIARPY